MTTFADEASAAAALRDPATQPQTLMDIAYQFPLLGVDVIRHPNIYPGLLDWLRQYGTPATKAEIAQRTGVPTPVVTPRPATPQPKATGLKTGPARVETTSLPDATILVPADAPADAAVLTKPMRSDVPSPPVDVGLVSAPAGVTSQPPQAPVPPPPSIVEAPAEVPVSAPTPQALDTGPQFVIGANQPSPTPVSAEQRLAEQLLGPAAPPPPPPTPAASAPATTPPPIVPSLMKPLAPATPAAEAPVSRGSGVVSIVAAIAVFIVCSIIQAAGGSSMFSGNYYHSGVGVDILVNLTFIPGWIVTGFLLLRGIVILATGSKTQ